MKLAITTAITLLAASSGARADTPSRCAVSVETKADRGRTTGKVTTLDGKPDQRDVHVDDGKAGLDFTLRAQLTPFAVGDTITVTYACGGWGHYCDARIDDAKGEPLILAMGLGGDALAAGWTSARGKVLEERQNPNTENKSIERTYALVLTKGKVSATVTPGACVTIKDGATTWFAGGSAHAWEGERPPEGVDSQMYGLIRKR